MSLGEWLKDVFGDGRLVSRLERDLDSLRLDFRERLRDKDALNAVLRGELAAEQGKNARLELAVYPTLSRAGMAWGEGMSPRKSLSDVVRLDAPEGTTNWQRYKREAEEEARRLYEEEGDGSAPGQA